MESQLFLLLPSCRNTGLQTAVTASTWVLQSKSGPQIAQQIGEGKMSESKNYSNQNQHFLEKKLANIEANTKQDRCAGLIQIQQESQE